jgi:hypothetical protein
VVKIMDDAERNRILQEAHATLDRLRFTQPVEPHDQTAPDPLDTWKRSRPQPEPKPRQRKLDTAPVDWSAVIDQRVGRMKTFVMDVIGEALRESFNIERAAYADALKERDRQIAKLECELAKQAAQVAKLEVRLIQSEIAHDDRSKVIDLPALPKRQDSVQLG